MSNGSNYILYHVAIYSIVYQKSWVGLFSNTNISSHIDEWKKFELSYVCFVVIKLIQPRYNKLSFFKFDDNKEQFQFFHKHVSNASFTSKETYYTACI